MAKQWWCLIAIVSLTSLVLQALAITDEADVQALRDLYRSLNSPVQLERWKLEGGDPCGELWTGVSCSMSSVIHLDLKGLGLNGNLGFQLSNLRNLKQLDLSSNNIDSEIPYDLPLNLTHLNLAGNRFSQSIPYSLDLMKNLRHLNFSHNELSGPLGNVFSGLQNLRGMDLSFNNFTGDLPASFKSLSNLTGLFLQGNQFTGSVIFLADLPLHDLNIEDNRFSGIIPEKFQSVNNLWIGGNKFDKETNYPPWKFPDIIPTEQNISSPPVTNLTAFESHPTHIASGHGKKRPGPSRIAMLVGGGTLIAAFAALFVVIRNHRSREKAVGEMGSCEGSARNRATSTVQGMDLWSMAAEDSPHVSGFSSSPLITPSRLPPIRTKTMKASKRKSFSGRKMPITAKIYSLGELQIATNNFSQENILGEGCLGSVYRAEFPDGTILAVKIINMVSLSIIEEEQFLDVIRNTSRLKHPNIVTLLGYCMEHGQYLLVYEYIRNLSLEDTLHRITYKPLSWGLRLHISLGIAQALNYMHSSCVPPVAHSNLKAANILLDETLTPHVSDCGLTILRPLTSNSVKLKASEMAISDSGYIAPEHAQPGISDTKADVYAFGVLLLELLTGRRPFDNSRSSSEQSLAKWASSRLHDNASLGEMIDPSIKQTMSSKSLSRFADIVSVCIQEFRPPMSEIVESLMSLVQKPACGTDGSSSTIEADSLEKSFRTANTKFFGSPTLSYFYV
ncbi:protein STRUBBELIG-RECEPTOR FAMILY 2 isoform X2 [Henckelia pumila]|uniref:protein STRUBBELIG-RECEPTOR FAMILY 2 isoform X2 n=1 Tax=Henckelia pumila TaxID=405737 RepID=UPI003C6DC123